MTDKSTKNLWHSLHVSAVGLRVLAYILVFYYVYVFFLQNLANHSHEEKHHLELKFQVELVLFGNAQ
jgi:hypothetical protein